MYCFKAVTEDREIRIKEEEKLNGEVTTEEQNIKTETESLDKLEGSLRKAREEKANALPGFFGGLLTAAVGVFTGNIQGILAGLSGVINGLKSSMSIDEVIKELEEKSQNAKRNLQNSKQKKSQLLASRDNVTLEISKMSGEIKNLVQLKSLCKAEAETIKSEIQNSVRNRDEKQTQIDGNSSLLADKNARLTAVTEEYNACKQRSDNLSATVGTIAGQMASAEKYFKSAADQVQALIPNSVKHLSDLKEQSNKLDKSISFLCKKVEKLELTETTLKPNLQKISQKKANQ